MIRIAGHNIISPLGKTSEENFQSVMEGKTALCRHENHFGLPEPFYGSLLDREMFHSRAEALGITSDHTFFELLCILSAADAIRRAGIDPADKDCVFLLSSTKGNVELLENNPGDERCYLHSSAIKIAKFFGNSNTPLVVSNACISGVCAQIEAVRLLLGGKFSKAVVIGCDVLSKFIISGFQSFKALSDDECRPYDNARKGLNLGEAAGSMVLQKIDEPGNDWLYLASSIHNDANHISGPSRTGEGCYRVLKDILTHTGHSKPAFVNAHGTATSYNDEMEAIALHRAALDDIPVNGLKGYFGHTLGAAGVIETILSTMALDAQVVLPTRGYASCGTSYPLDISDKARKANGDYFIKILSGFGGSNAGISYKKGGDI